jgi:pyruvate dehydrogenase E2 component (dihydrolipoamide acetyltransferase)
MTLAKRIHAVTMPKWGIEMTEGTLTEWTAREGQPVSKGDPLLEVETDKIINTVEAPASGVLRRITASVGEVKAVGTLIAVLADESVSEADVSSFIDGFKGASVSFEPEGAEPAGAEPEGAEPQPVPAADGVTRGAASLDAAVADEPRVSPIARRLADRLGIDVSKIQGTGRNGRVSKEDVEAYAAQIAAAAAAPGRSSVAAAPGQSPGAGARATGATAPGTAARLATAANPSTRTKLSATRATIARRLTESKQTIPHYRVQMDVDVGKLQARRKDLAAQHGLKISLNDMLVSCTAQALIQHPVLNAHLEADEIVQYQHADIAIAVATDGGLITPIVRGADQKTPVDIARVTADLADRAKRGALTREDITGGTFSISNLGMYGLTSFDAIINPPQVAILAVGAAQDRVIVRNGAPAVAPMLTLTLSADHRVVDGAVSAAFLATLRDIAQT